MIYTLVENKYSYIKPFAYKIRRTIYTNVLESVNHTVDFEIKLDSSYLLIKYLNFIRLKLCITLGGVILHKI
jgi:hypothetical protein